MKKCVAHAWLCASALPHHIDRLSPNRPLNQPSDQSSHVPYIVSQKMLNAHAGAAESPYLSPRWNYNMPDVHPFTTFMEHINVNLETLYSDGTKRRAGSHALHALAVLLETRGLFDSSDGSCYHACCVPSRRGVGLPSTLSRYAYAEWPWCTFTGPARGICLCGCMQQLFSASLVGPTMQVLLGPQCNSMQCVY